MAKSILDILNTGYGVLNPEFPGITGKNYNENESGFFDHAVKTINTTMGESFVASRKGPMVGICLRNDGRVSESGWIDPACWASTASQIVEEGSTLDLVQIRVRIPELHGMLEIPKDLPDRFTPDENHDIINQYPVFVSQFSNVAEPAAGDLVWVDFQNKESQLGPVFLGVAESNNVSGKSTNSGESASQEFKKKKDKRKLEGTKTSPESERYKFGLLYRNRDLFTGMFPPGTSEEEFKKRLPSRFTDNNNGVGGPQTYYDLAKKAIQDHSPNMPMALLVALIEIESNFNYKAKSGAANKATKLLMNPPYNFKPTNDTRFGNPGAKGLGQFMNVTSGYEVSQKFGGPVDNGVFGSLLHDPFKPKENIPATVKYLHRLIKKRRNNDPVTGLHAYNAGPGNTPAAGTKISDKWVNPRYSEKILRYYHHYQTGEVLEKMPKK